MNQWSRIMGVIPANSSFVSNQLDLVKPLVLASAAGLPYNIEIHAWKSANDTGEPFGTSMVKNELEVCERRSNHSVNFDNFFSSHHLLSGFDRKGFQATGTIRKDRLIKCPLIAMKQMKRKKRRSYDYRSDGKIEIVRRNDNSIVTLAMHTVLNH